MSKAELEASPSPLKAINIVKGNIVISIRDRNSVNTLILVDCGVFSLCLYRVGDKNGLDVRNCHA